MIPNPWLLLAIGIAIVSAATGGAYFGYQYRDGKVAKEVATAQSEAIKEANANAVIDMQAAYERGQQEAKVRVVTRTIQGDANVITIEKPIPDTCRLDDDRMRLISRAVASANNESPPAGLPNVVPETGKPGVK